MADAKYVAGRVQMARARCSERDKNHMRILAMRQGQYEKVAPGLFNTGEIDQPLVANLIDTTARDVAEVMAPLPAVNCETASLASAAENNRQNTRAAIANGYIQYSRLQNQMFSGTDRYGSFGFMAYAVEADYDDQMPCIRVSTNQSAYYTLDYKGKCREYFEVFSCEPRQLCAIYPEAEGYLKAKYVNFLDTQKVEVVRWHDAKETSLVLLDCNLVLDSAPNPLGRCMVHVVERPNITDGAPRGQFDDVIWVQIARAVVQMYTMNALERSVNAPMVAPKDVSEVPLGPFSILQTDNPQGVGVVPLNITPGLFPESQALQMEQMQGSRYPEGRSGSIDASIITGQGVQALMGTFDTQVQTFQRLNASALEDVIADCFELDETLWGNITKEVRIKDNGAPRKFSYTPKKDIVGDYSVDVTYGAIAGLDPNRGLVFLLQSLAGGLIAKSTARKHLPVDLNIVKEERQIQLEQLDDSIAAAMSQLPLVIPQMVPVGQDPRDIVLALVEMRKSVAKGTPPAEAMEKVFAPKQQELPPEQAALAPPAPPGAPQQGLPGQGTGGASDLLMTLAGLNQSGGANLQANVSQQKPI